MSVDRALPARRLPPAGRQQPIARARAKSGVVGARDSGCLGDLRPPARPVGPFALMHGDSAFRSLAALSGSAMEGPATSGRVRVAVGDAERSIGEVFGERGGFLRVAAKPPEPARGRLGDSRDHQVIQLVLQRRELLGGIGRCGVVAHGVCRDRRAEASAANRRQPALVRSRDAEDARREPRAPGVARRAPRVGDRVRPFGHGSGWARVC
jgi:hypothetical protein